MSGVKGAIAAGAFAGALRGYYKGVQEVAKQVNRVEKRHVPKAIKGLARKGMKAARKANLTLAPGVAYREATRHATTGAVKRLEVIGAAAPKLVMKKTRRGAMLGAAAAGLMYGVGRYRSRKQKLVQDPVGVQDGRLVKSAAALKVLRSLPKPPKLKPQVNRPPVTNGLGTMPQPLGAMGAAPPSIAPMTAVGAKPLMNTVTPASAGMVGGMTRPSAPGSSLIKSAAKAPWDKKNPKEAKGKSKKLTPEQKAKAKARAKAAGRPYPNWIDNAHVAKTASMLVGFVDELGKIAAQLPQSPNSQTMRIRQKARARTLAKTAEVEHPYKRGNTKKTWTGRKDTMYASDQFVSDFDSPNFLDAERGIAFEHYRKKRMLGLMPGHGAVIQSYYDEHDNAPELKKLRSDLEATGYRNKKTTGIQLQKMAEETAAWQRKEGKDPKGGLNRKGVESYRKQNPGSKLQMAVTKDPSKIKEGSKDDKRRKSFCARMSGMPGPLYDKNGKPTRKKLALDKWNC